MKWFRYVLFALLLGIAPTFVYRESLATVNEDDASDVYIGNGSTTVFNYNFRILNQNYIKVYVDGALRTIGTHYNVGGVGAGAGGTVTFVTAPAANTRVALVRGSPVAQPTNYTNNEAYNSAKLMADLDRLAILAQQLQEQINRAYRVSVGYTPAALPNVCAAGQKMMGYDSTGAIQCDTDLNSAAAASNAFDQITNPSGNSSISFANTRATWTWGTATGSNPMFNFTDTTANTGTGAVVQINSTGTSTALPIKITAQGTTNGVQMSSAGTLSAIGSGGITATSLSSTLAIANGGTGQTTATAAFNALDPLTTKGDIIVHDGTNSVRQAVGANNLVLTADSTQTNGVRWADTSLWVIKSADETVNNSAAFQNDDHLVFVCATNTSYFVDGLFLLNAASTTPSFKFQWTVPSGASMFWGPISRSGVGAGDTSVYWSGHALGGTAEALLTEASTTTIQSLNGTTGLTMKAIVRCAGTGGNVQLQWAQNTANASDSKLLKDSHLQVRKLN